MPCEPAERMKAVTLFRALGLSNAALESGFTQPWFAPALICLVLCFFGLVCVLKKPVTQPFAPLCVVVLWINNWVVLSWWLRRHRMTRFSHFTPRRSEGVRLQGGLPAQTAGLKQCQKTLCRRRWLFKSAASSWCSCCQKIRSTERERSLTHIIYILKKEKETDRQKSGHISRKVPAGRQTNKSEDVVSNYVRCGVEFCEQSNRFRFCFWPDENVLLSLASFHG